MRFGLRMLAFALAALIIGVPALAERRGYLIAIVGRVIAVDRTAGTIRLRHGMLETVHPEVETCVVPRKRLRFIQPGMELSALADTRHRPWRLENVHHFRASGAQHHADRVGVAAAPVPKTVSVTD